MDGHSNRENLRLRGGLLLKGHTVTSWARSKGFDRANLCNAIAGRRKGPKHRRMVEELKRDLEA